MKHGAVRLHMRHQCLDYETVEAAAEDDQPEASPLANVDVNVDDDPMDVDVPVSAAKPVVRDEDEAAANDEN